MSDKNMRTWLTRKEEWWGYIVIKPKAAGAWQASIQTRGAAALPDGPAPRRFPGRMLILSTQRWKLSFTVIED